MNEPLLPFDASTTEASLDDYRPLHVGNLIYLPFARHLAEEELQEEPKAA